MAELTEKPGIEVVPTLVKVSEIDKEAEKIRKQRELPKKPGTVVSFQEGMDWLRLLNPEMQNRIMVYVYRLDPIINRQLVDPEADNNIDVISDGFSLLTEQYFIDTHGGGKYELLIKDTDATNIKDGFFKARLTIPKSLHPPKIGDLREVDWEDKNNKGYKQWARGQRLIDNNNMPIIESKNGKIDTSNSGNGNPDAMVQAMKIAMEFATKMSDKEQANLKKQLGAEDSLGKSIGEILLEKMKQEDPNKNLATITTLMTAVQSMQPKQVDRPDNTLSVIIPMFTQMLTSAQAASDKQFQIMMELLKENKKGGEEPTNKIDELKALIEVAKELKGGGSSSKSTAEVVVDAISNNLTPVLNIVGSVLAMKMNAQNPGNLPLTPKNRTETGGLAQTLTDQVTSQTNPSTNNPTNPIPANQPAIQQSNAIKLIQAYDDVILSKLGRKGYEFGALLDDMFGDVEVAGFTKYGVDGLLQAAKAVPKFWDKVLATFGEEHFTKWLGDFVNYREIIQKLEEEEENGEGEEENEK